ncbi:MAG TPA: amino acid ABC transporter substrate-binding protein [Methylomirabilota bacterium]|jgi:branched-chain amino acid transport system substrate-binding protein|nr:amino acid ABC transporter substrate-binding protein [Methylomirabilota bacterium]
MKIGRLPRLLAALVVLGGLHGSALAQGPIRVGASISLTGTYAKPGTYGRDGYLLCQKQVNDRGGLLGRKIEFVLYDDRSDAQTGVRLYEKLLTEDKVEVVMGPYSSAITEAVANVTEKYGKVMMAPLASTTSIWEKGRKNLFMVVSPAETFLQGLIDMASRFGLRSVALINEDTLFPKASVKGAVELARKKGMEVVFQEAYPKGNTDFSAILTKVKAARPDVLGAATYFDDVVAITRQMKELDVNVKMFGSTVGGDLPEFYKLLGRTAEYVYGASLWEPGLPYPGAREFVAAFEKEFGRPPSYHSASAYAGCQIFVEAATRVGALDGERLRAELLKLRTRTIFGDYAVDERGFQVGHRGVTIQWQDGKQVVVWPDEVAAGKARFPTPPWSRR